MEETTYDIRQSDTLAAWQQALAEVPANPCPERRAAATQG